MSIISFLFVAFVGVVTVLYFGAPQRFRWLVLLAASTVFYASFGGRALVLLALSILADFALARLIGQTSQPGRRRLYLGLSLAINLGSLALFKYFTPAVRGLDTSVAWLSFARNLHILGTPIGLSFFTFAKLGYVIDVFRRQTSPEPSLGYFATFVAFFPNITSGPIERATHLLPQLKAGQPFDAARAAEGLRRVLWGVCKKVVIADRLAIYVDAVYNQPRYYSGPALFLATLFLAFQIYADFSAYTDIALGIAHLLGIDLFENFRQPYFATSVFDFWRRWHISLTNWIREYLLFPLSRGLLRKFRQRVAPQALQVVVYLAVMGLVGLWHGASLTFVAWGLLHGLYLSVELALPARLRQPPHGRWETALRLGVTFGLVSLAWILFRANSLSDAGYIVSHMLSLRGDFWSAILYVIPVDPGVSALFTLLGLTAAPDQSLRLIGLVLSLALIGVLLLADLSDARGGFLQSVSRAPAWLRWSFYYAVTAGILFLGSWGQQAFLYFRF